MSGTIRVVVAVVLGLVVGMAVNGGLIMASSHVIAPPAGADVTTMEGLKASLHLFEPRHFLFPFLAHALGTLAGAFTASLIAAPRGKWPALGVGALFLTAGIANVVMLPAPMWFNATDLLLAYLPFAWLGHWLAPARAGAAA